METFTCAYCRRTFEKARSDEEAAAELVANFGPQAMSEKLEVLCVDCHEKFMAWYRSRN